MNPILKWDLRELEAREQHLERLHGALQGLQSGIQPWEEVRVAEGTPALSRVAEGTPALSVVPPPPSGHVALTVIPTLKKTTI